MPWYYNVFIHVVLWVLRATAAGVIAVALWYTALLVIARPGGKDFIPPLIVGLGTAVLWRLLEGIVAYL